MSSLRESAMKYRLSHPNATKAEVGYAVGCGPGTVEDADARLRLQGKLKKKSTAPKRKDGALKHLPAVTQGQDSPNIAEILKTQKVKTLDEQKKILSWIADNAEEAGNRTTAIRALADLEAKTGTRDNIGPGVPQTDDQRIERAGRILRFCGKSIARRAYKWAFTQEPATSHAATVDTNTTSSVITPSPSPSTSSATPAIKKLPLGGTAKRLLGTKEWLKENPKKGPPND